MSAEHLIEQVIRGASPAQVLTEGLKWNKKGSGDYATYDSTEGRFSIWKRRDTGNWDMKIGRAHV